MPHKPLEWMLLLLLLLQLVLLVAAGSEAESLSSGAVKRIVTFSRHQNCSVRLFLSFIIYDMNVETRLPPWREERLSKNILDLTEFVNAPKRTRSSEQI